MIEERNITRLSSSTSPRPRARLVDVASAAGVSKSAAAQVLSGNGGRNVRVSEETARRVRAAAKQLAYRPHHRARALAQNRASSIGLLYGRTSPFHSGMYARLIGKLAQVVTQAHRDLILIPAIGNPDLWGRKLVDQRIDGCLVMDPMPENLESVLADHPLPAVLLNLHSPLPLPQVLFDDAQGTKLAVDHLLALGHRRIAFLRERSRTQEHYSVPARLDSFGAAMAEAGAGDGASVLYRSDLEATLDAVARAPDRAPTAIICYAEATAALVLELAYARGLRIPDQLSVMTYGRLVGRADLLVPKLTYVRLPVDDLVRVGAQWLLEMIGGDRPLTQDPPARQVLSERLVVRQSTGPARA